jgi:hypothetical protein
MIQKVAEASTLRRAFDISGLYLPEEVSENEVEVVSGDQPTLAFSKLKEALLSKSPSWHNYQAVTQTAF